MKVLSTSELLLVESIGDARTLEEIEDACAAFRATAGGASRDQATLTAAIAPKAYAYLRRLTTHPAFLAWLDTYFGRRPGAYRSLQQRPGFIYYPSLPPQPWFDAARLPAMDALRPLIADVAAELRTWLHGERTFSPYVASEARASSLWRELAGNPAWSSIHLIRGGKPDTQLLEQLPRAADLLRRAPLAQLPPHAPEAFVSRLQPGVELPSHYGVSNIKLTAHLPVDIPESGCSLTVAGESRSWPEGDFMIFDDSFLHSAANRSNRARTVLIFDIDHPGLDAEERAALAHAIRAMDVLNATTRGVAAG